MKRRDPSKAVVAAKKAAASGLKGYLRGTQKLVSAIESKLPSSAQQRKVTSRRKRK